MGGFCPGGFWQGGFLSRGFLSGGLCPGGFVRGVFVLIPSQLAINVCLDKSKRQIYLNNKKGLNSCYMLYKSCSKHFKAV